MEFIERIGCKTGGVSVSPFVSSVKGTSDPSAYLFVSVMLSGWVKWVGGAGRWVGGWGGVDVAGGGRQGCTGVVMGRGISHTSPWSGPPSTLGLCHGGTPSG